jgi:hypothetical protein
MGTELDMLAIGNCILLKEEQALGLDLGSRASLAPD